MRRARVVRLALSASCLCALSGVQSLAAVHCPERSVFDAPELGVASDTPAAFALEARAHLTSLIAHRYVRLESDRETVDRYGRRLAYVIRDDGMFVNAEMLRAGLARISARLPLRRLD